MDLPLFPLKTVLFPGAVLPLRVFEPRYMDMVKQCLRDDTSFGVCAITAGEEVGEVPNCADVGTLCRILSWEMPQLGILNLRTQGTRRFIIRSRHATPQRLLRGKVTLLPDASGEPVPPQYAVLTNVLRELIDRVGEEHFTDELQFDDADWVSWRLAEILPLKLSAKQAMLEVNEPEVRLKVALEFLRRHGLA